MNTRLSEKQKQEILQYLYKQENYISNELRIHKDLGHHPLSINTNIMQLKKSKLVEAEYKFASDIEGWETEGREQVLFVQLTEDGVYEVEKPENLIQPNSTIPMNNNTNNFYGSVNAPFSILQNANNNTVTITQNIDQNIAEILKSLEQLKQTIQNLPTDEKEDAEDFLHYIQEEIEKPSGQRDESKIVKNLKRFCKIAFPFVLSGIINGADFTNNITDLATKFNVELPQLPMIK